jgi:Kef-type K+ transport system membrane component KefB
MPHLFLQLSSILVLATLFGILARILKQPLIVAYIFTGIIISVFGLFSAIDKSTLELLSSLGIAFLLFLVGIDLKIDDLKYVGKAAIYMGFGQILFTAIVGFVLISALGFSTVSALYIAIAITFSSTVIIVKLLAEKNDLQSLYGKITIGYLLVQDFVAIVALMILSGFGNSHVPSIATVALIFTKGAGLVLFTYLITKFALKPIFKFASSSVELLFVAAVAWAFLLSAVAEQAGFSITIGAFLAGIAIASSPYRMQISARVKPLRDFFIIIFFILLGASFSFGAIGFSLPKIVILSVFILIGKPLIVLAIMLTLKFRNRTSFLTAATVAQVSEFSLILMTVGLGLGHVNSAEVSIVAAVGVVTITLSSYLILHGSSIYKVLQKPLNRLFPEKGNDPYVSHSENLKDHVILVGGEQMGSDILNFLSGKISDKNQIVVIDFNPEIFNQLQGAGYNAVFGDISDPEVLEELALGKAKLLIITDPDISDSAQIIAMARKKDYKGPIISSSYWIHDAIKLYEMGVDYVVVPEMVGGKHIARVLSDNWDELGKIKKEKSKRFEELVSHKIF